MNKSIYDKAIETLNKYRNQNYNSTNKDEVELANAINVILPKYVKQEKLLKLYKEIKNNSKELIVLAEHYSWSWKLYFEIEDIQYKIKGLENDK